MENLVQGWGLWGLFISAFISSTLFPGGSEALLVALALDGTHPASTLLWVATLGNTLGGMSSWLIGWWIARRWPARELVKPEHLRAVSRVRRWGAPLLLLSWLPVVGDPLCVAAGWLRINPAMSALCIAVGKAIRYAVLLAVV